MSTSRLNPVFERCLTVAGRQRGGQVLRVVFLSTTLALIMVALVLVPGLTGDVDPRALAAGGGRLLDLVATVQVAAACILTPLFMAAALQRDADPIAWDVLRSTPLAPWRIVTGLLAGRALPAVALVLATLPALLLLRLAGGVPIQAVVASTAIALAVTCVSATTAVMFAAARLGARPSIIAYLVLVAAALGATWGMDAVLSTGLDATGRRAPTPVTGLNPFLTLGAVLRPGLLAPVDNWWTGAPLRSFLLLSAAVVVVCWVVAVTLSMRDAPPALRERSTARAHRPIGQHPIAWRESSGRPRANMTNAARWTLSALILAAGVTLSFMAPGDTTAGTLLASLLIATAGGLLTIGVLLAASSVARERDDRTLDLLLTTPLEGRDYLRGKMLGLCGLLWPPAAAAMVVALTAATIGWSLPTPEASGGRMLPGGFAAYAMGLPGLVVLGLSIGLTWSVRSRRWTSAAAAGLSMTGVLVIAATALIAGVHDQVGGLGPALLGGDALLSPATAVDPARWFPGWAAGVASPRASVLVGGAVGGTALTLAAILVFKTTAQTFTPTVRRLAGLD